MFRQLNAIIEIKDISDMRLVKTTNGVYIQIRKSHPLFDVIRTNFDAPLDKIINELSGKTIIFRTDDFDAIDALLFKIKEIQLQNLLFIASKNIDLLLYVKRKTKGKILTLIELDVISYDKKFYDILLKHYRIDGVIFPVETYNRIPTEVLSLNNEYYILVKGIDINSEYKISNTKYIDYIIFTIQ